MPSVNINITELGPVVTVYIGVSAPRRVILERLGKPIPEPVRCQLLIDTGASRTNIDPWIIQTLSLTPTGCVEVHTPSTTAGNAHICHQYDVSLTIPHPGINRIFNAISVLEAALSHQGLDGLLGRDILANCLFVYNGELGIYTLSF